MNCVNGEGRAPSELRLAWMCGDHHLPEAGSIMDQDYGLLQRMKGSANIYHALTKMRSLVGDQIHRLTPAERRIIRDLHKDGYC